ncbi:TRAP transporter small permease [Roseomonas terrae]|uniref:TRAP transporter small permease protein n=1 Tax=Neoroseomonas terrae TaxID=424799 RepID=A0ABS5ECT0_9PROT|nr:TRAP transporter small permease [Neoroseomonas terrae]
MSGAVGPAPAPLRAARALRRGTAAAAALMAHIAGWAYVAGALFITFDIVARSFLGFSSQATVEVTGYLLAGGIAWSLAHTLFRRAHIRVDVFVSRLPVRIRAPLHLFSLALLTAMSILFAWAAWELVDESALFQAHDNSALHIEMVWPQGIWAVGISAFVVACLVLMLEATLVLFCGRGAALDGLLGSRTLEDETEEALEAVAMAHEGDKR